MLSFKKNSLFSLILPVFSLFIVSCASYPEDHGYIMNNENFNKITIGETSKDEVISLLGSPSTKSDFGPEKWTYIGKRANAVAFFEPKVTEHKIVSLEFAPDGRVSKIEKYGLNNMAKIASIKETTPTEGNKLSLLEQLLGNLGRFNSEGRNSPTLP